MAFVLFLVSFLSFLDVFSMETPSNVSFMPPTPVASDEKPLALRVRVGSFNMSFACGLGLAIGSEKLFIEQSGSCLSRSLGEKNPASGYLQLWENSLRMVKDFFSHGEGSGVKPAVLGLQELSEAGKVDPTVSTVVQGTERIEAELTALNPTLRFAKCQVHDDAQRAHSERVCVFDAAKVKKFRSLGFLIFLEGH